MTKMRSIEIDFDVHQAIELERTGFDESPNAALRRLLKLPASASPEKPEVVTPRPIEAQPLGRPWFGKGVELPHGTELRMEYRGQVYRGVIEQGEWLVDGKRSKSPSDAAGSAAITKSGTRPSLNGWIYWEVKRPQDAHWRKLQSLKPK